ncbi:MAG: hypothetical protein H7A25_26570 [Leptospiraceae bacterium]|nr:hypothetical protein [Leptospiraceae bacterium]
MKLNHKLEIKIFAEKDDSSIGQFCNLFKNDLNFIDIEIFTYPDNMEEFDKYDIFFTPTFILKINDNSVRYHG